MSNSGIASELLTQALHLPAEDRESLALDLLASIPADDDDGLVPDSELVETIRQRIAQRDAGQAGTIDPATFAAKVRAAAHVSRQP